MSTIAVRVSGPAGNESRAEAVAREHSRVARRSIILVLDARRYHEIPSSSLIRVSR